MSAELAIPDDDDSREPATTDAAAAEVVTPAETQPADPAKVIYADITGGGDRRPIVPERFQREQLRATVELWAGLQWHRARYHALRSPGYILAALFWAVVGTLRLILQQIHWWWLLEQHDLRSDAIINSNSPEWRSLHRIAEKSRKGRGMWLLAEVAAALIVSLVLALAAPWWAWPPAATAAALLAARFGRPSGHRIVAPAVVPPQYEAPTHGLIVDALGSLGIRNINQAIKDGAGIRFVSEVMRDGPGWGVQLDLPRGVTAGHILAKRPELASGLRRPLSATWPEGVPAEHEGRLALWVGFHDISRAKPAKYPLLKSGTADIFGSIPFGTDPRQRPVTAPMFEVNWLIGAAPGQGKTATVRVIASGAALDPVCDLWVHELAGKRDLEPFARVSHRYCSGLDDEAIAYAVESVRLLRKELTYRQGVLRRMKNPPREGKITRELAMHYMRLRPIVAIFDEVQNAFLHPQFGSELAADLAFLIRVARAWGIIIVLATQRPDSQSLPTTIRGIVTARFCLKVPDWDSNDMILGTGAYKAGYDAVVFRLKTDAGLGWLKADADPQIVRTYYLDIPAAERIAERARVMRDKAGVLTGYALGLDDEPAAPRDVLGDLLDVFGTDTGMHWPVAAIRLAERFPDRWADATGEALSAQCRALGVASVDVRMDDGVLKGCRRVAVEKAMP